mgnify:CR=1 FL=1
MKKIYIFTFLCTLITPYIFSQTRYTYVSQPTKSDYYLERKIQERKSTTEKKSNSRAGILTRFGYSYNDDAFMYGVGVFYHFDGLLGVSIGFDGYSISHIYLLNENGEIVEDEHNYGLPMWDLRAGLMLGKYFAFGGVIGKCNIEGCNNDNYHTTLHQNKNLWGSKMTEGIYGAYITFILPITTHFGVNMDFAMTNHTGFNISFGVNVQMPIK